MMCCVAANILAFACSSAATGCTCFFHLQIFVVANRAAYMVLLSFVMLFFIDTQIA